MAKKAPLTLERTIGWILAVCGIIGFIAAFVLTIDKIHLIQDPSYVPSCSINPIISCGSVMKTAQSSVFGFPNSLIGIAGFAIISTIGMALLAGARFKRWFWLCTQAGVVFGIAFVTWLQYQTLYSIGALCPYCMVVWSVMIPIFWYVTLYNIRTGNIRIKRGGGFLQRHHGEILLVWFLIILGLILNRFWYYWSTLL